jgi:amino acid transporter
MPELGKPHLARAIGRWSLAALMVNTTIGAGIFGLPSLIAALVGQFSPLAVLLAGIAIGVIVAVFAEVASRFNSTGGPYLYTHTAFGSFIGILTAWLLYVTRLASAGAVTNVFVSYLAEFWPSAGGAMPRIAVITTLVVLLVTVNYRGVRAGVRANNFFTVAKLAPLGVFIIFGALYMLTAPPSAKAYTSTASLRAWIDALLLLFWAYGGFESALLPMGESKDPRRDAPIALFAAILVCIAVYTLVQVVVIGILTDPAATTRPLASAAHYFLGPRGAVLISLGAMLSTFGWMTSFMLLNSRTTFALAEKRELPPILAAIHPRFQSPYVSIVMLGILWWVFALWGGFRWNVGFSAAGRLIEYVAVCASLPLFRRTRPGEAALVIPGGKLVAILGIVISLVLVTSVDRTALLILSLVVVVTLANWLWARGYGHSLPTPELHRP